VSEAGARVSGHGSRVIWEPGAGEAASSRMREFMDRVGATRDVRLETYRDVLEWSVSDLSGFWEALREFFNVTGDGFDGPALVGEQLQLGTHAPDDVRQAR
jgi:acetoacetyl-CoA synthetase